MDDGAIIDAVFDSFRHPPPSGFDRIMVEKALLWVNSFCWLPNYYPTPLGGLLPERDCQQTTIIILSWFLCWKKILPLNLPFDVMNKTPDRLFKNDRIVFTLLLSFSSKPDRERQRDTREKERHDELYLKVTLGKKLAHLFFKEKSLISSNHT